MKVDIIKMIQIVGNRSGRMLAAVKVEMLKETYQVLMYRSSGRNSNAFGEWFPSSGTIPIGIDYDNNVKWIIGKDFMIGNRGKIKIHQTNISSKKDHGNYKKRMNAFKNLPFNLEELSAAVKIEFEERDKNIGSKIEKTYQISDIGEKELKEIEIWTNQIIKTGRANHPNEIKSILENYSIEEIPKEKATRRGGM